MAALLLPLPAPKAVVDAAACQPSTSNSPSFCSTVYANPQCSGSSCSRLQSFCRPSWSLLPRFPTTGMCPLARGIWGQHFNLGFLLELDEYCAHSQMEMHMAMATALLVRNQACLLQREPFRRDMLQEYVKNVQPDFMEKFVKRAPEQVVEAMRQTVTNMLGTLPPQFFEISVSTVAENLAQLMYSVMMTGYMFRNAQFRMDLQQSISQVALRDPKFKDTLYEPGVNKAKVAGEVLKWHKEDGVENIPAVEYIEMLESEIRELEQQLESSRRASRGRNELLEYLKSLQPQNLQELTTTAGEDALEAMNTFITRLLGVKDPAQLKRAATETSAQELAKLLYWLMVVGYSIRNIEVRYDMERILGVPVSSQKLAELPPGENI